MNPTPELKSQIQDLFDLFLRNIDIRNNSPLGSSRFNRAADKANRIEIQASLLVFGDSDHTMTECINEIE